MSTYYSSSTGPSSYLPKISFQDETAPCRCLKIGKIAALVGSTVFAAAALHINLVEQPARLSLDYPGALKHWKESYTRAKPIQSGIAAVVGIGGAAMAYKSGEKIWLLGAGLILANWPFTIIFMMPLNNKLMATSEAIADASTRADLHRWNKLHAVRTVLGFSAVAAFAYALFTTTK